MSRDLIGIQDMVTAGERIMRYLQGVARSAFLSNDEKQSAVFGQLVILGEAANRISQTFQQAHSEIPWRRLIGLRNRIVHGYDEIDWEIVWNVADHELPKLVPPLRDLLATQAQ